MIRVVESEDGKQVTLTMPQKFDFSVHRDFRKCYESSRPATFVVDLKNTSYMDSSALGMLLQLREHAGGKNDSVQILNATKNIRETLNIANFGELMSLE